MEAQCENKGSESIVDVTTDREACPKHWYVAQVRSCCEKRAAAKIKALGIETFVPTQIEIRQWSDRKKKIDRILLPMLVIFKGTPEDVKRINGLPLVYSILKIPGTAKPAIIPEDQMERFKFIVDNSDTEITIEANEFSKGDPVKIVRGKLMGLEGYVKNATHSKSKISIVIDFLGCASIELPTSDIKLID